MHGLDQIGPQQPLFLGRQRAESGQGRIRCDRRWRHRDAETPGEAGQQFFERCQDILGEVEAAEDALSDHGRSPKGTLRISSTPGFAQHRLLPLLADFQARHPSLRLELQLTGQAIDLVAERVDLAIRLGPLKETSLIARPLGESRRQVCAAPATRARSRPARGRSQRRAGMTQAYALPAPSAEDFVRNALRDSRGRPASPVPGYS